MQPQNNPPPILEMRGISKTFPGVKALSNVNLTVYPGEVPARLPGQAFWQSQGFQFEAFRPQSMNVDQPLPHIRLDAALEFLIGDKLR